MSLELLDTETNIFLLILSFFLESGRLVFGSSYYLAAQPFMISVVLDLKVGWNRF
uniref:Uncharacterized protein n=1 Tax=Heterorhabditis bacteriophora TaxID=37862 RepID=A0A1I7W763_HETBA